MANGHAGGHPRAGGGTVHLTVGEHAHVAADASVVHSIGEDRPVEEGEVIGIGVMQRKGLLGRLSGRPGCCDEVLYRALPHRKPEVGGIGKGVERAAVADVDRHISVTRDVDSLIEVGREGRDAGEAGGARLTVTNIDGDLDEAGGHLQPEPGLGLLRGNEPAVHGPAGYGNRGVPAHRRIALVVSEEHANRSIRVVGLDGNDAVHVRMPARLEHQHAAQLVVIPEGLAALVEDRATAEIGVPLDHDPHRLATGVHLDGLQNRSAHGAESMDG